MTLKIATGLGILLSSGACLVCLKPWVHFLKKKDVRNKVVNMTKMMQEDCHKYQRCTEQLERTLTGIACKGTPGHQDCILNFLFQTKRLQGNLVKRERREKENKIHLDQLCGIRPPVLTEVHICAVLQFRHGYVWLLST